MTSVNSVRTVSNIAAASTEVSIQPSSSSNINFSQFPGEEVITIRQVNSDVKHFISANKKDMELNDQWYHFIVGEDHIIYKPKGNITYGQLREQLGIPPKVLSETNNKRLKDDDLIPKGGVKINLNDIGWYPQSGLSPEDCAVNNNLRANGILTAGYDRAISNKEIISMFK